MCTLTLVTRNDTYVMAMNRDEKIARGAGLPPETCELGGTKATYPSDGAGGTAVTCTMSIPAGSGATVTLNVDGPPTEPVGALSPDTVAALAAHLQVTARAKLGRSLTRSLTSEIFR